MIIEGKSSRFISNWLKEKDESISHAAINRYRKGDFNIKDEAAKQYNEKQSKKRKNKAAKKVVSDLEALDEIIKEGNEIKLQLNSISPDMEAGVSDLDIEKVKIQGKNLVIRAAKAKHDILRDEPTPLVVVPVEDVDDIEQKLIKQLADDIARQPEDKESDPGKQ